MVPIPNKQAMRNNRTLACRIQTQIMKNRQGIYQWNLQMWWPSESHSNCSVQVKMCADPNIIAHLSTISNNSLMLSQRTDQTVQHCRHSSNWVGRTTTRGRILCETKHPRAIKQLIMLKTWLETPWLKSTSSRTTTSLSSNFSRSWMSKQWTKTTGVALSSKYPSAMKT